VASFPAKRFGFSKEDRIRRPLEFKRAREKGKRYSTRSFIVYVFPNDLSKKRLGLSISRKAGSAVKRNRLKRLLREFFRTNNPLFPESSDIVISAMASPPPSCFTYKGVEEELGGLFKQRQK
jgi:ribonuclease P protein component